MKEEFKDFRTLLRKSIGPYRSQAEFAADADISPEHLNRMINSKLIARPTKKTLAKIAGNAYGGISYNQLLKVCGYEIDEKQEPMSTEAMIEEIRKITSIISNSLDECKGVKHRSLDWILSLIIALYTETKISYNIKKTGDAESSQYDKYAITEMSWSIDPLHSTGIEFVIYYCETRGGEVIIIDTSFDAEDVCSYDEEPIPIMQDEGKDVCRYIRERKPKNRHRYVNGLTSEDLLEAILEDRPERISVVEGYGFYLDRTPEFVYRRFLEAHKEAYCVSEEEKRMFHAYIKDGQPRDEAFKEELSGWAEPVAKIIARETGLCIEAWNDDEDLYEFENRPSVMLQKGMPWNMKQLEKNLSEDSFMMIMDAYAREFMTEVMECYFMMMVDGC